MYGEFTDEDFIANLQRISLDLVDCGIRSKLEVLSLNPGGSKNVLKT